MFFVQVVIIRGFGSCHISRGFRAKGSGFRVVTVVLGSWKEHLGSPVIPFCPLCRLGFPY